MRITYFSSSAYTTSFKPSRLCFVETHESNAPASAVEGGGIVIAGGVRFKLGKISGPSEVTEAAIRKQAEACNAAGIPLPERNTEDRMLQEAVEADQEVRGRIKEGLDS